MPEVAVDESTGPAEENVIDLVEAGAEAAEDEPDLDKAFALDDELENGLIAEPEVEEDF